MIINVTGNSRTVLSRICYAYFHGQLTTENELPLVLLMIALMLLYQLQRQRNCFHTRNVTLGI